MSIENGKIKFMTVDTALTLIAHRGASGYVPENTLLAFAKAIAMGAASIEFDVQQTKDNRLVIIHDMDLKRVGGVRKAVGALTYAELSRIEVGGWFDPRFKGEKMPLLKDLLDLAHERAPGRIELQLEIKNGRKPYAGIERRVLELLASRPQWAARVVISSFDHGVLARVRALSPRMRLGYLVGGVQRRSAVLKEVQGLNCESVHLSLRRTDRAWVEAAHAEGLKVLVYTVNTAPECGRLSAMGVDGVFTNFPDVLTRRDSADGHY